MENVSKNIKGLGIRLGQARTKLGFSQSYLADLIGISRPNYTAIENENEGRFLKDYQLKNACKNLNVSSDYLLGLISDPNPNPDIMGVTKLLGISSSTVYKLRSFQNVFHSSDILSTFDNFTNYFDKTFWDLIYLYKKLKKFYTEQYQFVLEFTNDINYDAISIFSNKMDFAAIESNKKYFYYDIEAAKKFYYFSANLFNEYSDNINKAFDLILESLKKGDYTENNLFLYDDCKKRDEFKVALQHLKTILYDLAMLVDFDETGLIFSTSMKEEEIRGIIDQILDLIESSSNEPIDSLIENLNSCLSWFSQTVEYSMNFIKFRINNLFGEYLESN